MLAAILHGKVSRRVEGSEDLLTSAVFGILEHLSPSCWLPPFFELAEPQSETLCQLSAVTSCQVEFWPLWRPERDEMGVEPDIVLWITLADGERLAIIVEVKRRAGKSGHGAQDQLARQASNGRLEAKRRGASLAGIVYLTAHIVRPNEEIVASEEASLEHFGETLPPIWWVSWRDLPVLLEELADEAADPLSRQVRQVAACLRKWGLERFQGFSPIVRVPDYTFIRAES